MRMIDHLGQSAEHVGVDAGRPAQPPCLGDAGDGEQHAEDQSDDAGAEGEDQRVRQARLEQIGDGLLVEVPVTERILQLRECRLRGGARTVVRRFRRGDRGEVGQLGCRHGLRAGLPAGRQRARHPVGVQPRPGAVRDDRVESGVQRVDQWLVLLGHRVCDEIVQAEGVFDDLRRDRRAGRCPAPAVTAPPTRRSAASSGWRTRCCSRGT